MNSLRDTLYGAIVLVTGATAAWAAQDGTVPAVAAGAGARFAAGAPAAAMAGGRPAARPALAARRGRQALRPDIRQRLDALQVERALPVRGAGAGVTGPGSAASAGAAGVTTPQGAAAGKGAGEDAGARPWRWRVNGGTGALSRLRADLALQGADVAERGTDLARRLAPLFGGDEGTTFAEPETVSRNASGQPAWLAVQQLVQGFPLADHALLIAFGGDDGTGGLELFPHAREVHGVLLPGTASVPAPTVDDGAAADAALAHLKLDLPALVAAPAVSGRAQALPDGRVRLLRRVELVVRAGLRPLAVDVDAHSGEVVGVRDNRCSGAGNLLWNGVALPFATGKGKGNVYGSVTNAAAGKESGVALTELTLQDVNQDSLSLTGTLTGRYASVADTHAVLYSPERSFPFSDSSSAAVGPIAQYEAFDHVNAYYWITRMAGWLGKLQGGLSSDTCLPVYVNYDQGGEGFINAFYSPQDLDGDGEGAGWSAGYFVFGDFDAVTGDPADDFARDPSVVCHEYTHAMVDKAGFTFGDGELDTPSRAINEAIADYAAASFLGDARIGHVFVAHSGDDLGIPGDALRDLSAPLTLADDLFDTLGSSTDMPEEHEAGRIFGAALWSARAALKAKVADDLVLNGLAGWPQSNAEAGFPVVDADNAQDAYTAFAFACFDSMMEDLLASGPAGARNAGKLLGAFLEHGLTGTGDDSVLFTFPLAEGGLSLDVASAFRGVLGSHRFALELAAGQQLSVAVTGLKADGTQVDFALQGAPGALGFPKPKKSAVTGASASQSQITVNQSGTCVLTVANTGATAGRYTLKLKVK